MTFDFRPELEAALAAAETIAVTAGGTPSDVAANTRRFKHEGSRTVQESSIYNEMPPNSVTTDAAHAFFPLVAQAWEVADPECSAEARFEIARNMTMHELAHAAVALELGHQALYSVRIIKGQKPDGEASIHIGPFISVYSPNVTTQDFAVIAAAPEDPSEDDLQLIKAAGFRSPEHIIRKHPYSRASNKTVLKRIRQSLGLS